MHNQAHRGKVRKPVSLMRFFWRALTLLAAIVATIVVGAFGAGFGAYYFLRPDLPSVAEMRDIPLQIPLRIYSRDGRLIEQVGEKRRTPVAYEDIPPLIIEAFLAAEDDRFFDHPGFDYQGILRAAINLAMTGQRAQGGSTITQQLAREYFLTRDRTFVRKARELILAIQIEQSFSKPEILSLYLNKIFLGQRAYGVVAAAEVYFGKRLAELSIAEAATIAGLPAAPSRLNPVSNPDQARDRRSYVLRRMHELGHINDEELQIALATPMQSFLHAPVVDLNAPYVAEMARSEMLQRFGQAAYDNGYQVVTTVDSRLQRAARQAMRGNLLEYDRRHGYRGPVAKLDLAALDTQATTAAAESNDLVATELLDLNFQEILKAYPGYGGLRAAVVTAVRPEADNTAEFFLRDVGRVVLPWERIRWRRFVNDSVVSGLPAGVNDLLQAGDVVYLLETLDGWQLAQVPQVQAALVALDPRDGAAVALTGGFDYNLSKFNRAVQARRQPGSAFKPFIYSAALEHGFTAATVVNDAPIVVTNTGQEEAWRPENYSNRFYGPTRLREALVRSMNLVSLRVLQKVGINKALEHIRPFSFDATALPRDLALALGSGGASPLQMATGFSAFANGGLSVEPYIVDRILDAQGRVLYQATPAMICEACADAWFDGREQNTGADASATADTPLLTTLQTGDMSEAALTSPEVPNYASVDEMLATADKWRPDYREAPLFNQDRQAAKRIIPPQNAYIVYDMMRDVIQRGTGQRARELGRRDLAGKTGTSNNRRDAWFAGLNRNLVGVAWVGFDDDARSLGAGEEGSRTALPMWKNFMTTALQNMPEAAVPQPHGIVSVRILSDTGQAAVAGEQGIFEIFQAGTEPRPVSDGNDFSSDAFIGAGGDESIF